MSSPSGSSQAAIEVNSRSQAAVGALGAIAAQGLNAASSLVVQLIAARALGVHGFGRFALIYSVLVALTALYTGWVGDSLVVLDRSNPKVRAGVSASVCLWLLAAVATGIACGSIVGGTWVETIEIAALLAIWLVEEAGRRIYTARRRYWALTANDLVYNAVALVSMAAIAHATGRLTIERLLVSMIIGSAAACLASVLNLPAAERRFPRPRVEALREIAKFGAWRSVNVGIRPLGLFFARTIAIAVYGAAALSSLQAGWLLLAPAMVVVNGAGLFLLPLLRERERTDGRLVPATVRIPIALLAVCAAGWSAIAIGLNRPLEHLLFSTSTSRLDAGKLTVAGWSAYVVALAVAIPLSLALVASRRPRDSARAQLVESLIGLALVGSGAAFAPPWTLPFAMALGVGSGACVTHALLAGLPKPASA